jgi:hypothetical protein
MSPRARRAAQAWLAVVDRLASALFWLAAGGLVVAIAMHLPAERACPAPSHAYSVELAP